nr:hypothetical protein [Tanacetum cinerariifolium]
MTLVSKGAESNTYAISWKLALYTMSFLELWSVQNYIEALHFFALQGGKMVVTRGSINGSKRVLIMTGNSLVWVMLWETQNNTG